MYLVNLILFIEENLDERDHSRWICKISWLYLFNILFKCQSPLNNGYLSASIQFRSILNPPLDSWRHLIEFEIPPAFFDLDKCKIFIVYEFLVLAKNNLNKINGKKVAEIILNDNPIYPLEIK